MTPKEVVARFQCKGDANGIKVDENGYRVDDLIGMLILRMETPPNGWFG